MKFNKKCKVLHVGRTNPTQQPVPGWKAKFSKWHMSQEGAVKAAEDADRILGGIRRTVATRLSEVTLPFSVLVRLHLKNSVLFRVLQ